MIKTTRRFKDMSIAKKLYLIVGAMAILITAYDTASDRKKAEAEGVDFFIAKPFTRDTIYQTVDLFTV